MSHWVELCWFAIVLALGLWVRELSRRLTDLQDNTLKVIDIIADRVNGDRKETRDMIDYALSTDAFRSLRKATEDEDWTRAAIVKLRAEGKFDAVQKFEEMEHQARRGVKHDVFKHLFRGIGWVPE